MIAVSSLVKSTRLRWLGRLARMDNSKIPNQMSIFASIHVRLKRRSQRTIWEDIVKDLEELSLDVSTAESLADGVTWPLGSQFLSLNEQFPSTAERHYDVTWSTVVRCSKSWLWTRSSTFCRRTTGQWAEEHRRSRPPKPQTPLMMNPVRIGEGFRRILLESLRAVWLMCAVCNGN